MPFRKIILVNFIIVDETQGQCGQNADLIDVKTNNSYVTAAVI
jgi:hypothetical protein